MRLGLMCLAMLLPSATTALACDIRLPAPGSVVTWPERILVGEVKVLRVRKVSEFQRFARLRIVRPIRGELPRTFGVLYDTTSCGSHFTQGEVRVGGFMQLPPEKWTKDYRFGADSYADTWARAVFVDGRLRLSDE
ncbi:hypothetical protein [Methylorubrum sp. SB2]|uniref:hypothetical protein n=1 Tax=Methylorubrum subtropicum TaxID=3138812 RepID=UPI00313AF619